MDIVGEQSESERQHGMRALQVLERMLEDEERVQARFRPSKQ